MKLYKSDSSKNTILYYYTGPLGACGTGKIDKRMYINNGIEADIEYYDNSEVWREISFHQINPNIAFINSRLEDRESQEVLEFVKTLRIINNESTTK